MIEDEEFIEPTEDKDYDVLNTILGMVALLNNEFKRKINEMKVDDLYVDYKFICGSVVRREILFSQFKYIKTDNRNK